MNCSILSLKNEFPEIERVFGKLSNTEVNKVNIKLFPPHVENRIEQWVNAANNQALELGFGKKIFPIRDEIALPGSIENRKLPHLIIDPNLNDAYQAFTISRELEIEQMQLEREEFIDEFSEVIEATDIYEDPYNYNNDLYSSIPFDHEPHSIVEEPVNFLQWKMTRLALLEKLNKTKKYFTKRGQREKLPQINQAIKDLELEIANFDENSLEVMHENILLEIETLNALLDLNHEDPVKAASIWETNAIRERIDNLTEAFYKKSSGGMFYDFHNGISEEESQSVIADISRLEDKYRESLEKLIFNIINNNELVQQHEAHFRETGRSEEYEAFITRIRELLDPENTEFKLDGDSFWGKNFLGASSYDSILAEIIALTRDINQNKEAGITALWKKNLKDAYDKIKNAKVGNEFFADLLFEKDEFGVRQEKLINYFSKDFYNQFKIFRTFAKDFYTARAANKAEEYSNWMNYLKGNADFLDLRKIKSFVESYSNEVDFNTFFTFSEAEMNEYEREMRSIMGNVAFELELEKQKQKASEFLTDQFNTDAEKFQNNPLAFLENFYSDNFDSKEKTTASFVVPTYVKTIPNINNTDHFREDFKEIERMGIDGFSEFYKNSKHLLDYVQEADIGANYNDIISLRDGASREALKNLNAFQKISKRQLVMLKDIFSEYYEGRFENPNNDPNYVRTLQTHYGNYGFKEMEKMATQYQALSFEKLVEKAKKNGLVIPDHYDGTKAFHKAKLANALAKKKVNASISLDLFKRINYATILAESANTRRSVVGLTSMIKEYAADNKLQNTLDFVQTWEANNIFQVGYQNHEQAGRWERVKLRHKIYTEAEKELIKLLKEQKENLEGNYNFNFGGNKYYTSEGKYYMKSGNVTTQLSLDQMEEAYGNYTKEIIDGLGTEMRIGTLIGGLAWNMFKTYLWTSLPSGWKNRLAGYNQNNEGAASGLYGFNMDDLINARRLLAGHNIRKTLNYAGLAKPLGLNGLKKKQQIDILLHLVESLGLLENVMQDADMGDGMGGGSQGNYAKVKEFMSDFAMNNPEFHNQMELLVAQMINVPITRVDGTVGKLYDPETMEFPFDPKTMKLKEEYRTEENIANWEKFVADSKGRAPQNRLIQSYLNVKHKLHGNYRPEDKIALQSTMTGRGMTAFMKWSFENFNNQYGTKKVSLATAQIDIKGRKVVLLERFPVFATHMLVQNVGIPAALAGTLSFMVGIPAVMTSAAGLIGIGFVGYVAVKNIKNVKMSWQDFSLSLNYLKEIALRTVKTSIVSNTRGLVNPFSEEFIDRRLNFTEEAYKDRNLTLKERRLISESAQEVADGMNMVIQFMIVGLTLKGLWLLMSGAAGDDEDEKMAKMERIEGTLKFLINTRNQMLEDLSRWTSHTGAVDTFSQVILLRFIEDIRKKMFLSMQKYQEGNISGEELAYLQLEGASSLVGFPRQILKMTQGKFFSDERIYDNTQKTWLDSYLLDSHLTGEAKYEKIVNLERRKARLELEKIYRKKTREEFKKLGRDDFHNMEEIVKRNVRRHLTKSGTYKKGKRNYENIYNSVDWKEIINKAKEDKVILESKKERK